MPINKLKEFSSDKPRDHVFFPDPHAVDPKIMKAVGNYVAKQQPEVFVCAGDFADMGSCSSYDVGKKSFEGKNYNKDIKDVNKLTKILFAPIRAKQKKISLTHKKRWNLLSIMTIGNHEERINRVIEDDARLYGLISIKDLGYEKYYTHVSPFLEPVIVDGVMYVHYGFKKITQRAIAGVNQARSLLQTYMCSITVGHTPEFHYAEDYRANGERIQCIVAGCCFNHHENYAGQRNNRYWRGIIHKREVSNGEYDYERISLDRLLRDYL